jgi:hypothetical protein
MICAEVIMLIGKDRARESYLAAIVVANPGHPHLAAP